MQVMSVNKLNNSVIFNKIQQGTRFSRIAWFLFIFILIFASTLPGINIPYLGLLYPYRIIVPIMFIFMIVSVRITLPKMHHKIAYVMIFMFLYGVLTLIWTPSFLTSVKSLFNLFINFLAVYVLIRFCQTQRKIDFLILSSGIILAVLVMIGIFESFTGTYLFNNDDNWLHIKSPQGLYSPLAVFVNTNDFSFTLLIFMPFFLSFIRRRYSRHAAIICTMVYVAILAFFSIAGMTRIIPIILAIYAYLWLFFKNRNLAICIFVIMCIVGLMFVMFNFSLVEKFLSESRIQIWLSVLKNAQAYLFLGIGPGNAAYPISGILYTHLSNPHAIFLEIFVEYGIIVFIVLFAIYLCAIRRVYLLWKKYKQNTDLMACFIFLVSLIFLNVISSSIIGIPFFWLIIAIVISLVCKSKKKNAK